ncbi:MAG: ABC transporter permease subunit [Bdellovibrionaceae bacterium]|nr:ABC transporter permease subunit [Pseudobdellovibrionaceae bacterium]
MLMLGERGATPEVYQKMQASLGLDQPVLLQYFKYLGQLFTGNFGTSITSQRPVFEEFMDRFPATMELGIVGMLFAILFGVPMGIISAAKRKTPLDYTLMGGALLGYSMPIFWWALVLIMFFSVQLGWTPVSGRISVMYEIDQVTGFLLIDSLLSEESWPAFKSALHHLILPAFVLGTIPLAVIARMTRSSLLEVLREDYIRTARAKGLTEQRVIVLHGLKNALIPIVTVIGLMLGAVLTGAILTETIFSWPGIGRWFVSSVEARDYPVIQGGIILIALTVMIVNLLVDLIYLWVNPLLREES